MGRYNINEIIPGQLYQRGQILSWPREQKESFFQEYGIDIVVNFWRKIDVELTDVRYFHLPSTGEDMLTEDMEIMADMIADLIDAGHTALILCEAGQTRSVYFTIMVYARLVDVRLKDAYDVVEGAVGKMKLRPQMLERIGVVQ